MTMDEGGMTREAVALVEAKARLLIDQAREAKLKAAQLEAVLALVVGVLANDPDLQEGLVLQRIAGQLRLCADVPELAAETIGCEVERVSPALLRAAAGVICDAGPDAEARASPMQAVTLH
jgi:hypothetical protein